MKLKSEKRHTENDVQSLFCGFRGQLKPNTQRLQARQRERTFVKCSCSLCTLIGHYSSSGSRMPPNTLESFAFIARTILSFSRGCCQHQWDAFAMWFHTHSLSLNLSRERFVHSRRVRDTIRYDRSRMRPHVIAVAQSLVRCAAHRPHVMSHQFFHTVAYGVSWKKKVSWESFVEQSRRVWVIILLSNVIIISERSGKRKRLNINTHNKKFI